MQAAYSLRLIGGILLSATLHGAVAFALSRQEPPPPVPEPFAIDALSQLAQGFFVNVAEGNRLVCASFPEVCQVERFVELDTSVPEEQPPDPVELAMNAPLPPIPTEEPQPNEVPPPPVPEPVVEPEPPKPEEKPVEETALMPTPPPPPVQPKERLKSVEQIVENEDAFNPDAQFLAEKTKIVEEQTQASVTSNYLMDKEAVAVADPERPEEELEGGDEKKVAGAENAAAAPTENKSQVRKENLIEPAAVPAPVGGEKPGKKGEEGAKAIAEDNIGDSATPVVKVGEEGSGGKGSEGSDKGGENSKPGKPGKPRLTLTMSDFEALYGSTEGAAKGQEDESASSKGGKGDKRRKFVMAQLENYLPEVKPGNQTALSTAADPFAKFLHQMHLRIHDKWGDGALRDFDKLGGSNPLNSPALLVTLEIVVRPDGTLEKAAPVGSSGYLPYDVAAVTAVFDSAPFPKPPESIRSYNGNVYLRWTLHRDTRQCATSFAEPFILTGPSAGAAPAPAPTPQ